MTSETFNYSLDDLVKKIFSKRKQSVWVAASGRKQSGKTNFVLRLIEKLHKLKLMDHFATNVKSLEAPFDIEFFQDFQSLKQYCQMMNPNPEKHGIKRILMFGSEMGKWLPRDQPHKNVKFIEELQLVRKYGLNWIGDFIDRVDKRVINATHFDGEFKKLSITRPDIATYENYQTGSEIEIWGIQPTTLKYDTWESCNFYMEPQTEESEIFLNPDHQIVQQYLEADCSIIKTGLHSNLVKRARDNVLKHYFKYHVHSTPQEISAIEDSSTEIEE
ncbi:MAG TPA: hypothetical protein VMW50_11720 [Dehalococcoidia bacterium]|nr:hypothetical protein [Dehalococcoidia bacterium]